MKRRNGSVHGGPRADRAARGRRRRRRFGLRLMRAGVWMIAFAGVFVLGIGFGRIAGGAEGQDNGRVTIENRLGMVTATQPVKTVTQTKTVTKVRTVRTPQRQRRNTR